MEKVYIIEMERGWGDRVDEVMEFSTVEEARNYCIEYNRKYNSPGPVLD